MMPPPTLQDLLDSVLSTRATRDADADNVAVSKGVLDEAEADFLNLVDALRTARQNNAGVNEAADAVATADVDRQTKRADYDSYLNALATSRNALREAIVLLQSALSAIPN